MYNVYIDDVLKIQKRPAVVTLAAVLEFLLTFVGLIVFVAACTFGIFPFSLLNGILFGVYPLAAFGFSTQALWRGTGWGSVIFCNITGLLYLKLILDIQEWTAFLAIVVTQLVLLFTPSARSFLHPSNQSLSLK